MVSRPWATLLGVLFLSIALAVVAVVVFPGLDSNSPAVTQSTINDDHVARVYRSSGFQPATAMVRDGHLLRVRIDATGLEVGLDLRGTAVFDCRTNCLEDVRASLAPLLANDRLCLYSIAHLEEDGRKLWINRQAEC